MSRLRLPFWEIRGFKPYGLIDRLAVSLRRVGSIGHIHGEAYGFEPWSSETIDVCHFLVRCSALLGYGKGCLAQRQDNVTVR